MTNLIGFSPINHAPPPEHSFSRAGESTLGTDYPNLRAKWQEWLAKGM